MADEKLAYENISQQMHSRQPVVAVDTSANPQPSLQPANAEGIQPINIPGSSSHSSTATTGISPTSPSKSYGNKTGTRSTFCPNTLRKGTKLTEDDYDHHERGEQPQPTGWLQMLGLKKSANYGDLIDKSDEPHHQSYY